MSYTLHKDLDGKKLVIEWSRLPRVNTGALVQARVRETDKQVRISATVVEPSASSHVSPRHKHAAEAPRCYEGHKIKNQWIKWFTGVLADDGRAQEMVEHALAYEGSKAARRVLAGAVTAYLEEQHNE